MFVEGLSISMASFESYWESLTRRWKQNTSTKVTASLALALAELVVTGVRAPSSPQGIGGAGMGWPFCI